MLLFFLPFLFFPLSFSSFHLIEHWECGADKWGITKNLAKWVVKPCHDHVENHINLCCKVHDNCYDHHYNTGVSQDLCDIQFCSCLQDALDKEKTSTDLICVRIIQVGCATVRAMRSVYPGAIPPGHSTNYINFEDYKPFFMNFRSMLDSCTANQKIIVHCHNTVFKCVLEDHEQDDIEWPYDGRRFGQISKSYQDCRATMYDCLRAVLGTSSSEQCTSTVLREREKVNIYKKITDDGDSINIAYPIVASRALERCPKLNNELHICYKDFYNCDVQTKEIRDKRYTQDLREACGLECKEPIDITEHPEYNFYDELRRINVTCHISLWQCLQNIVNDKGGVIFETDLCIQAFGMAVNRIRLEEYHPVRYSTSVPITDYFGPLLASLDDY